VRACLAARTSPAAFSPLSSRQQPTGRAIVAALPTIVRESLRKVGQTQEGAVAYWGGVDPQTVTKWRKALSVRRAIVARFIGRSPFVIAGCPEQWANQGDSPTPPMLVESNSSRLSLEDIDSSRKTAI
jgi:hypothetical protein